MVDLNILTINVSSGSSLRTSVPERTKNLHDLFATQIPGMDVIFFQEAFNLSIFEDIGQINGKTKRYIFVV